jgi:hypothetical protein
MEKYSNYRLKTHHIKSVEELAATIDNYRKKLATLYPHITKGDSSNDIAQKFWTIKEAKKSSSGSMISKSSSKYYEESIFKSINHRQVKMALKLAASLNSVITEFNFIQGFTENETHGEIESYAKYYEKPITEKAVKPETKKASTGGLGAWLTGSE